MTFQSLKESNHPQILIQEMKIVDYLMIGATIRIGREMLCLPYAGFFHQEIAGGPPQSSALHSPDRVQDSEEQNYEEVHLQFLMKKS